MTDDDLQRSTRRLGDRFGTAKSSPEADTQDSTGDDAPRPENESERSPASSRSSELSAGSEPSTPVSREQTEPEWVPTTLYLPEETRREFRRFLKRLTLDHPEIEEAQKRELHTALIRVGMEHPEAVAERTDEQANEG